MKMASLTLVNTTMRRKVDLVYIILPMEIGMKDNGKMICNMAKEYSTLPMEQEYKDNGIKMKDMANVSFIQNHRKRFKNGNEEI